MSNIFHYKKVEQFYDVFNRNALTIENWSGDEIDIGKNEKDDHGTIKKHNEFVYVFEKNRKKYLLPSKIAEEEFLRLDVEDNDCVKIPVRGTVYRKVVNVNRVNIKPEKLMDYYDMINCWCNFKHANNEGLTAAKIVTERAYNSRVNVSIMTLPGWCKDSLLLSLQRLLGYSVTINKPSYPKLKKHLRDETRCIGVNELNKVKDEKAHELASYIEDTGDFKEVWNNPTANTTGTVSDCRIGNLSNLYFYNYPNEYTKAGNPIKYQKQARELIEYNSNLNHPKIQRRIFPLLFEGGHYAWEDDVYKVISAVQEDFTKQIKPLTDEEYNFFIKFIKTVLYYQKYGFEEASKKNFVPQYKLKDNTKQQNYNELYQGVKLYSKDQEMANYWENIIHNAHTDYYKYIKDFDINLKKELETKQNG